MLLLMMLLLAPPAAALPGRTVESVYYRARRLFNEDVKVGAWTTAEIEELERLVETEGKNWVAIGELLNRHEHACMDKHKSLHAIAGTKKIGTRLLSPSTHSLVHSLTDS